MQLILKPCLTRYKEQLDYVAESSTHLKHNFIGPIPRIFQRNKKIVMLGKGILFNTWWFYTRSVLVYHYLQVKVLIPDKILISCIPCTVRSQRTCSARWANGCLCTLSWMHGRNTTKISSNNKKKKKRLYWQL